MAHQFMHVKQEVELQKISPRMHQNSPFWRQSKISGDGHSPIPIPLSRWGEGHHLPTPTSSASAPRSSRLRRWNSRLRRSTSAPTASRPLRTTLACHINQKIVPAPLKLSVIFLHRCQHWPSADFRAQFYGDGPRVTPPPDALNPRGVAKYSDFWPVEGYISRTAQDTASGTIND